MPQNITSDDIPEPSTLQEAINIIKYLKTSHKQEKEKFKELFRKQAEIIKNLEFNRQSELEFVSKELKNYEINLEERTEAITKELAEKDKIIAQQLETIEELHNKIKVFDYSSPEIHISVTGDSNSDSGFAMDNEDSSTKIEETKIVVKPSRKCSRRFADSISFLRRVDFSPIKYKPRENTKKKDGKKNNLEVPNSKFHCQVSNDRVLSEDERPLSAEPTLLDGSLEMFVFTQKPMNDSMNNHFSDDASDDTSEEVFDRAMARSSVRKSVKTNPKYKKINRNKSKLLEEIKVNIAN